MSRRFVVSFFALSLLTCTYSIGKMQSAQAQRTSSTTTPAKQTWVYCAITGSGNMNENGIAVGSATIVYFEKSGSRKEDVRIQGERVGTPINGEYQRARDTALATTIAQLGSQGWEMVGQLPYSSNFRSAIEEPTAMYFKRPNE